MSEVRPKDKRSTGKGGAEAVINKMQKALAKSKKRSKVRFEGAEDEVEEEMDAAAAADQLADVEAAPEAEAGGGEGDAARPKRKKRKGSSYTALLRQEDGVEEGDGAEGSAGQAVADPGAAAAAAAALVARSTPLWAGEDPSALPTPVPVVPAKKKKERHAAAVEAAAVESEVVGAATTPSAAAAHPAADKGERVKGKPAAAAATAAVAGGSAPAVGNTGGWEGEAGETPSAAAAHAKEYLVQWKNDKKNWKFKKVRQTWILRHLYDESQLDNTTFKIASRYIKPLAGEVREKTLREAQEILDAYGAKPMYDEARDGGEGAAAPTAPTLSEGARKAVAFVPVMNENVLARAQRVAYLLS